jgi:phosphatidylserine decarboxylase
MRIPITKDGLPQMAGSTVVLAALAWVAIRFIWWPLVIVPFAIWIWVIAFFRDPDRTVPTGVGIFVSPADGTITDITELDDPDVGKPCVSIGIFLSVFNVHVNRMPMSGKILRVTARAGKCLDARSPESRTQNVARTIVFDPIVPNVGPIAVRQITGLLARRIVCHANSGQVYTVGERYGMIKFGSRTELIIPKESPLDIHVRPGDKVQGGATILATLDSHVTHPAESPNHERHPHPPQSATA